MSENEPPKPPEDDPKSARANEIFGWQVGETQRRVEAYSMRFRDPAYRDLAQQLEGRKTPSVERARITGAREGTVETRVDGVWVKDKNYSPTPDPIEAPKPRHRGERR